ncbi:hypothetical protein M9H77_07953 [Catharanthus roseus]|uniref:Uncharacterized protein n=1 Tax=Catharanthus roseus TaxID=4058 RepID=A0ACC0BWD7_CATRO|nr:hypothetical protein M9H77_07953 [Catharanthus roseus]
MAELRLKRRGPPPLETFITNQSHWESARRRNLRDRPKRKDRPPFYSGFYCEDPPSPSLLSASVPFSQPQLPVSRLATGLAFVVHGQNGFRLSANNKIQVFSPGSLLKLEFDTKKVASEGWRKGQKEL